MSGALNAVNTDVFFGEFGVEKMVFQALHEDQS